MGRVAPRFQQKKTSENNNEESELRAKNKSTPLTIQESQTQRVVLPTKSMDNGNNEEQLSRKERPTFKANDSRQKVTVEVHPKRYHSLPNLRKKSQNLQHQGIIWPRSSRVSFWVTSERTERECKYHVHFTSRAARDIRGGSRGRVQGVRTLPWDDLRFSNTTGILPKKKNYVVYWCWSRARDECTPS